MRNFPGASAKGTADGTPIHVSSFSSFSTRSRFRPFSSRCEDGRDGSAGFLCPAGPGSLQAWFTELSKVRSQPVVFTCEADKEVATRLLLFINIEAIHPF